MCILQCTNVCMLRITLHINACSGYFCTLKAQRYTQFGTSHTWVKGVPPFYGLKEDNWRAEWLCPPNPFLAQVSRIFKIRGFIDAWPQKLVKRSESKTLWPGVKYIYQTTTTNCSFVGGKELPVGQYPRKLWHIKERLVKWKVSLVIPYT